MGATLILALAVGGLALALGVAVGGRRGLGAGLAAGLGILAAAVIASVAVFTWSLPMGPASVSGNPRKPSPSPPLEAVPMKNPLHLSLEADRKTVQRGEVPAFKLTLRNAGEAPERVINLSGGRRPDLQDTYYDLVVTQGGKSVDLPRMISDPGLIVEQDFLTLQPGEQVTFALTRFAAGLQ